MKMKNIRGLCRLCFRKLSSTDFKQIEEITREIFNVLLVQPINLDISQEHRICLNCVEDLRNFFDFKSTCLYTEDFIVPFINPEGGTKVDLNEVYMKKEGNANLINIQDSQKICRLCLKFLTDNDFVPLYKQEGDLISIQDLIRKYIPELDLNVTTKPVICAACVKSLENYSGFVEKCADTENKIKDYCKVNGIVREVELTEVLQFAQKQILGHKIGSTSVSKTEEPLGNMEKNYSTGIIIKKEDIEELEPVRFDGIDENVGIKSEVEKGVTGLKDEIEIKYCDLQSPSLLEMLKQNNAVHQKMIKNRNRKIPSNKRDANMKIYKCNVCGYTTKYRISFINHDLVHKDPSEIVWFQCQLCSRKFKRKEDVKKHMLVHNLPGQQIYQCENCPYKTNRKNCFSKHQMVHSDPSEINWFYCHLCPHKTKRKTHLNSHLLTHEKKVEKQIYKCAKCIFQTKLKCILRTHMVSHTDPSELKMYSCEVCSFKSKYKPSLSSHMRKHYNDPRQYQCKMCTFATKYEESLRKHMITHKDPSDLPTYKCAQCSYESIHKSRLSSHVLIHMDQSKLAMHKCSQCNYKSPIKGELSKHLKIHKDPSELIMHSCKLCPYKTYRHRISQHMLVHKDPSEVAMFECTVCGFKTKHKIYLGRHMLIHDPSKGTVYNCNTCAFTSVNRSNFRTHLRKHKKNINK